MKSGDSELAAPVVAMLAALRLPALRELERAFTPLLRRGEPTPTHRRTEELGHLAELVRAELAERRPGDRRPPRVPRKAYDRDRPPGAPSSRALVRRYGSWLAAYLASPVEVVDLRAIPDDIGKLPFGKNQAGSYVWRKIADAAVVVTDLKASTAVSYSKQDRVGARLYEASTGGCVNVLNRFSPGFVDIQGDGVFAIFTGDRFLERALCAAVSLNTFGQNLRQTLAKELGDDVREMRESGLRIGADRGALLVKRIGVRGTHNEPVWAGKPVNFATKCAQEADAGQVVVTARFFGDFKDNEFVRYSCGCVDGENRSEAGPLWERVTVPELGERHSSACRLRSAWCHQHGDEFARAILSGEKRRRGLNTGSLKKWREPEETRNDLE